MQYFGRLSMDIREVICKHFRNYALGEIHLTWMNGEKSLSPQMPMPIEDTLRHFAFELPKLSCQTNGNVWK